MFLLQLSADIDSNLPIMDFTEDCGNKIKIEYLEPFESSRRPWLVRLELLPKMNSSERKDIYLIRTLKSKK